MRIVDGSCHFFCRCQACELWIGPWRLLASHESSCCGPSGRRRGHTGQQPASAQDCDVDAPNPPSDPTQAVGKPVSGCKCIVCHGTDCGPVLKCGGCSACAHVSCAGHSEWDPPPNWLCSPCLKRSRACAAGAGAGAGAGSGSGAGYGAGAGATGPPAGAGAGNCDDAGDFFMVTPPRHGQPSHWREVGCLTGSDAWSSLSGAWDQLRWRAADVGAKARVIGWAAVCTGSALTAQVAASATTYPPLGAQHLGQATSALVKSTVDVGSTVTSTAGQVLQAGVTQVLARSSARVCDGPRTDNPGCLRFRLPRSPSPWQKPWQTTRCLPKCWRRPPMLPRRC